MTSGRVEDRLDERTARKIAIGRLKMVSDQLEEGAAVPNIHPSRSSKARLRQLMMLLRARWGQLLLGWRVDGRTLTYFVAAPLDEPGSAGIAVLRKNTRSDALGGAVLLHITPHAIARLMERRRSVKVEELVAEEFRHADVIDALVRAAAAGEEQRLETVNGHFVVAPNEGDAVLAALTWIPSPR